MSRLTNTQLAAVWHWAALALAAALFGWEVYGTWGHYWLRGRMKGELGAGKKP